MSKIKNIIARQVFDSRGIPTIEVEVHTELANIGCAIVPSGKSKGTNEAVELRDNNKQKWNGQSVFNAVKNVNEKIANALIGIESTKQKLIDQKLIELDGSDNKSKLGANAILAVSTAIAVAASKDFMTSKYGYLNLYSKGKEASIPVPMINIINGGQHANNGTEFQEYMIMPIAAPSFNEAMRWSAEVFYALERILIENKANTNKGDEGGFAPKFNNVEEPLALIVEAIDAAGYKPGRDIAIAIDVAASTFYDKSSKLYAFESTNESLTSEELISFYKKLVDKYPIVSIEDPFDQSDWEGFSKLNEELGKNIQIVGDDLYVTNKALLQKGIDKKATNAILIKPNQIGTLSETFETILLAKQNNINVIISHRSGDSEDTFIADLAVAFDAKQIKTGSLSRSERVSKYNQLLRISESVSKYSYKDIFGKIEIKQFK